MRYLKQSTSVDRGIGPFLDETDGKTAETALTITQPDVRLKKNGGNWAQKAAAQTLAHEEAGWYEVTLDATDTDTIGELIVAIHESGALPVWEAFHVLAPNVYDSLFGAATDKLDVNIEEWNTTAVPAEHTAGYPVVTVKDGTGTGEIDTTSGGVLVAAIAAGAITAAAIATDAIDADAMAANAIDAAVIATGAITAAKFAAGAIDAAAIATNAIDADAIAADAVTEIQAGLATAAALATVQTSLPVQIKKNTALANFEFPMYDSTDHVTLKTGLTVTGTVSIDGAAFTALTNAVSEVASGVYKVSLAAADVNGTTITLKFAATGADTTLVGIVTQV